MKNPDVENYLNTIAEPRRREVETVREVIRQHLPAGYEEKIEYGMLSYQVPLSTYPDTYNKKPLMYAALAAQKNHLALYLCNVYGSEDLRRKLEKGFSAADKKLDMGKSCLRFQTADDLPLSVIGDIISAVPMQEYIDYAKSIRRS